MPTQKPRGTRDKGFEIDEFRANHQMVMVFVDTVEQITTESPQS